MMVEAETTQAPLRQFTISMRDAEITLFLTPATHFLAELLRAEVDPGVIDTPLEHLIELIRLTLDRCERYNDRASDYISLLYELYSSFQSHFISSSNIHVAIKTHGISSDRAEAVLRVYYRLLAYVKTCSDLAPALLSCARLFGVFGGQGNTDDYFNDLRTVFMIYEPVVVVLLKRADDHLQNLVRNSNQLDLYPDGLSPLLWLNNKDKQPDKAYLLAAPASMPLIALTQLCWYYSAAITSGMSFDAFRDSFKAFTGHSQGIVSAAVASASKCPESFIKNSMDALTLLFHLGTQSTRAFPPTALDPHVLQDSVAGGEGMPSPMLLVSGLSSEQVSNNIAGTNKHLPDSQHVYIGLKNGPKAYVVAGPPKTLYGLVLRLRKLASAPKGDLSRVPLKKRGLKFRVRFLPISAPFHSPYLESVVTLIEKTESFKFNINFNDLGVALLSTADGSDMRNSTQKSLAIQLISEITCQQMDWVKATNADVTHYVDFGPGGKCGAGALINRNRRGAGVSVLFATVLDAKVGLHAFFDCRSDSLLFGSNWAEQFSPRLVQIGGKLHLDTKFSRLLGRPPIMVAGMTPTTVSGEFVSAVINAGYHIELSGGGHFTEQMLRDKIKEIMGLTKPGDAITINILFLNPRQWAFQYPLVQEMRKEGYPIEGVCIAAGVPSYEMACEVLDNLFSCGIKHVSFKPGSAETIRHVLRIAKARSEYPILLQWTGGRGGGHHSYEDMHAPILETYAEIRECDNIVLVAGSGLGGIDDTLLYLTGDWSLEYSVAAMPYDAVLFGSRMLVAKEAKTSDKVKQLIVECPGVANDKWDESYEKPTGGILTVKSELGEPIHKVATRNVILWKELDNDYFSLPPVQMLEKLKKNKEYIVDRLRKDAHKVWFGQKLDGKPADLHEMTYREVMERIYELCFIKKLKCWIDKSYSALFSDVLERVEERFTPIMEIENTAINPTELLESPRTLLDRFISKYPRCNKQLLTTEDCFYFISVFKNPTRKPVPFVPIFDEQFEIWYKRDSLWQSEFLEAVVDEDPQRVCILQGPVATVHANKANVAVKEILDTVYNGQISAVLKRYYQNDRKQVGKREFLTAFKLANSCTLIDADNHETMQVFSINGTLPGNGEWLEKITSGSPGWMSALLLSPHIVQGHMISENYVSNLFRPRPNLKVTRQNRVLNLFLDGSAMPNITVKECGSNLVSLVLSHYFDGHVAPLTIMFKYCPECPALIHEDVDSRIKSVKLFYSKTWNAVYPSENAIVYKCTHVVDRQNVIKFCNVVQNNSELYVDKGQSKLAAPMDYATVAGWNAIIQPLFGPLVNGDLLQLVHLSNECRMVSEGAFICAGDTLETSASVVSIVNQPTGKAISVHAVISRESQDLVEIKSSFFIRGSFSDYHQTFEIFNESPARLEIKSQKDIEILKSKKYIKFSADPEIAGVYEFRLKTRVDYHDAKSYSSISTKGTISLIQSHSNTIVGNVDYVVKQTVAAKTSPVVAMLARLGAEIIDQPSYFEADKRFVIHSSKFVSPGLGHAYASVSGDYNPIHTCPVFADLASLPSTITHGMWTSATLRKYVELYAAENTPKRVHEIKVEFMDISLPNTEMDVVLRMVGMNNGRKLIEAVASRGDGTIIAKLTAQVDQASTCYVFTGQGSQEINMGMDLYESSPHARKVWDDAEKHLLSMYGLSILEIVRTNPRSKTVYFGGKVGRRIRQTYRSMSVDVSTIDGKAVTKPLFPDITDKSESYTFKSPQGLLFATQFAQPALVLFAKAAFDDMHAKGLVCENAPYAGHSLGEYGALSAVANVIPTESLVDIGFYRGMTMQSAVTRDTEGNSTYGMCAVNPMRVHSSFDSTALAMLIKKLAIYGLLEIVNYNVESWQYVVAGSTRALIVLTRVLNAVSKGVYDEKELEKIAKEIDFSKAVLERGHATIPLSGIDVPFHSSFLLPGVDPFRVYLYSKIKVNLVNVERLENKYIPNLVAQPFTLTRDYVQLVYDATGSIILKRQLDNFDVSTPERVQQLAHVLLIELLAYQLASPVQWIKTQELLFSEFKIERLIEIGPSNTLANMAARTIALKYTAVDDALSVKRQNLSYMRDKSEICYEHFELNQAGENQAVENQNVVNQNIVNQTVENQNIVNQAVENQNVDQVQAAAIDDKAIDSGLLIKCMVAQKLKKPVAQLASEKSVKDLSGGKSTLQNEILGDLQKELNVIPENAESRPIKDLGTNVEVKGLGKHTTALVAKMISSKMPGGFSMSQVKSYLRQKYGLGPNQSDALLLVATTAEPESRLSSEDDAKKYLDSMAAVYSSVTGIKYTYATTNTSTSGGAMISASQLAVLFSSQKKLWSTQIRALATALEIDLNEAAQIVQKQLEMLAEAEAKLDLWALEYGSDHLSGVSPVFEPKKARMFDSEWNWVRQDAIQLFFEIIFGRLTAVDRDLIARCRHVINRSDESVNQFMEHWLTNHSPFFVHVNNENYALVRKLGAELVLQCRGAISKPPIYKEVYYPTAPQTTVTETGEIKYCEINRSGVRKISAYVDLMEKNQYLHVQEQAGKWVYSEAKTKTLFSVLRNVASNGLSLLNKSILITGCGRDSIGAAILQGCLSAGARVIVTTSRFSKQVTEYYRSIYERYGSSGSQLIVVPFNQASATDVSKLVKYIYVDLQWDLDFVLPFAAIPENGRELTDIDQKSELAHRIMLVNLLRLLGAIITEKRSRGVKSRPAMVILPMSPNHGVFGGDGMYGESKIGLETLLNRWHSESWADYLCIVGAVIGWTRGTGLMNSNDMVAHGVEELGVYTFSTAEMAFNLLALMDHEIVSIVQEESIVVDLAGRMNMVSNLKESVAKLRNDILIRSEISGAIKRDMQIEEESIFKAEKKKKISPRANLAFDYPSLPSYDELYSKLGHLQGMIDLESVVVITGYGEVGPYGNARTRWEMEAYGQFSLEGCIEMAWMMGFIKHHQGILSGAPYAGWVDTETGKPVKDTEIKSKYEARILMHTGIRLVEPEINHGYNPAAKSFLQEVSIEEDMCPMEVSEEEAAAFKAQNLEFCSVEKKTTGEFIVTLKRGARVYIPKALSFSRLVAGQLPTGWSAKRFGVPDDIISQVDPVTLYVLVSTAEALVNSGITDPYEFYKYVHVSEVGNTTGSGVGGMLAHRRVYRDRYLDKSVQSDILQESFINSMAAWVNLLLMSSSGPIKTPVGACATAVKSIEIAVETIQTGKAKVVLAGGFDDFLEEGSYEFASMKATSNAEDEIAMGREPKEMCRPGASSRGGFMESMGAGVQVLMSAATAVEMGVPIYAVIAHTSTATDKEGRSLPAPGKGILTTAKQTKGSFEPKVLDLAYRRQKIENGKKLILERGKDEMQSVIQQAESIDAEMRQVFIQERHEEISANCNRETRHLYATWSNEFYRGNPRIAPLRGALAVWGLTIDDLSVASLHGTGTKANDINESQVVNAQLKHLGRNQCNPLPVVFQKHLTGHPKGAAAAWMLNGLVQAMQTGIVPGNRNADNIDAQLKHVPYLMFPSVSIQTDGLRAGMLKSFGFGQVGGEIIVVHPFHVLAVLSKHSYTSYVQKRERRQEKSYRYWHDTLTGTQNFVQVKSEAPYTNDEEIYLDPLARATWQEDKYVVESHLQDTAINEITSLLDKKGVGVDIEQISVFEEASSEFIARNFTRREIDYCRASPHPAASFAVRWAAKEAVIKAISSFDTSASKVWQGAGAPLCSIEIVMGVSGAPQVAFHGEADEARKKAQVSNVKVSLSHSGEYAMATSIAQ